MAKQIIILNKHECPQLYIKNADKRGQWMFLIKAAFAILVQFEIHYAS